MGANVLEFEVFSGGKVEINLSKCKQCESKACVDVCNSPNMGKVLELKDGIPALQKSLEDIKRGGCTECLGCELDCDLYGEQAIKITLPIKELDE